MILKRAADMIEFFNNGQGGMSFLPSPTPQTMMSGMRPLSHNSTSYGLPPSPYYPYPTQGLSLAMTGRSQQIRPEIMVNDSLMEHDDVFAEPEMEVGLFARLSLILNVNF